MAILGPQQKAFMLEYVRNNISLITINDLVGIIIQYDDVYITDFQPILPENVYINLIDACRDPQEKSAWDIIKSKYDLLERQHRTLSSLADAVLNEHINGNDSLGAAIEDYETRYPNAPMSGEAAKIRSSLYTFKVEAIDERNRRADAAREQNEWDALDKDDYNKLRTYKQKWPNSVHKDEIDDFMWNIVEKSPSINNLNRYLSDWKIGHHVNEANQAIAEINDWNEVKRSKNIYLVKGYIDAHPNSVFINEARALYYELRDKMLVAMKANPSKFTKDDVQQILNLGIFTQYELIDEGLMTEQSRENLFNFDIKALPNIQTFNIEDPNITAMEGCTDIYLFGTPGTGKSCLLMGLAGANGSTDNLGQNYVLNMKVNGGPYAAALQQYTLSGHTTGHTFGKYVTTINGNVNEFDRRHNVLSHKINLVEMSGEEFAMRISENKEVSLGHMGTGATNLMRNSNRKVFFIIIDPSQDNLKIDFVEEVKDTDGNVIEERKGYRNINQLDILSKFVSLFSLPENQEIMSRVDAIHFVVTKADLLGNPQERLERARQLLLSKYPGPIAMLQDYCRQTKRINYSTDYRPKVFTFSLGKFYLGDVFDFDKSETLGIVNVIRNITSSKRERSWWDRFVDILN